MKHFSIGLLFMFGAVQLWALPTAKYTLKVVDSSGAPISGANASVSFMKQASSGGGKTYYIEGVTDSDGVYTGSGETQQYGVYGARADGFYGTSYTYNGLKSVSGIIGFRRWQPWNPTLEVVLKKIKNPIAMYAFDFGADSITIPKLDQFIGYDLIKRDWVVPHGKGLNADFKFKVKKNVKGRRDYTAELEIQFSHEQDGIQLLDPSLIGGSQLRSNHDAPNDKYNSTWKRSIRINSKEVFYPFDGKGNYYFRVRCTQGPESCLYGKIYGDIRLSSVSKIETGLIEFGKYYLNPNMGDRNVEFDPKKNKFNDLPRLHQVTAP